MTAFGKNDPTISNLRSGFGLQVKSPNNTEPLWGFGTSHRDAAMKLYLSEEQTKAMGGNNSQGPIYKTYEAIGEQAESKYSTLPMPGFGSAPRIPKPLRSEAPGPGHYPHDSGIGNQKESIRPSSQRPVFGDATRDVQSKVWLDEEAMKTYYGRDTPAPNSYQTYQGIGKQTDSKHTTEPAWRQGTASRFRDRLPHDDTPGAGQYTTYNSIGKQPLSSKTTLPSPKIGSGSRDALSNKTFISKEHEKAQFGLWTPGPGTANRVNAIGPQTLSVKNTSPSWGFGSGKRNMLLSTDSPGPGTYFA